MWWPLLAGRLRRRGLIGLNARNVGGLLRHNPRALFPIVDDKLQLARLGNRVGVRTPVIHGVISSHRDLAQLGTLLDAHADCVIKPARGSAGRGILILTGPADDAVGYRRHDGTTIRLDEIRRHLSDLLSGMYSLGSRPDQALIQQRLRTHPSLEAISVGGTPDVRILLYRGEPAMAMLRLSTRRSGGRANLHQGGLGVGVEVSTGITTRAIWQGKRIETHPDTGAGLAGRQVPFWSAILETARTLARATGLGYVGVDVVVDPDAGPMVLEANARPGLAIQLANGIGLGLALTRIDRQFDERQRGRSSIS